MQINYMKHGLTGKEGKNSKEKFYFYRSINYINKQNERTHQDKGDATP